MQLSLNITIAPDEVEALARLFPQFARLAQPEAAPEPEQKKRVVVKSAVQAGEVLAKANLPITLASGNVDWRVEIDGLPVHWMLDYPVGKFPAARGQEIIWQGARYRLSHIYGTSLKVTSQDADTYQTQNGSNGMEAHV